MRTWLIALGLGLMAGCSPSTDLPAGEKAIVTFHAQLDEGRFAEIYGKSSPGMKKAATGEQLGQFLAAVHRKLGLFQSGQTVGWRDNVTTGGHVLNMTYAAKYEHGDAEENFVFRFNGADAVLEGYHVNSTALITN